MSEIFNHPNNFFPSTLQIRPLCLIVFLFHVTCSENTITNQQLEQQEGILVPSASDQVSYFVIEAPSSQQENNALGDTASIVQSQAHPRSKRHTKKLLLFKKIIILKKLLKKKLIKKLPLLAGLGLLGGRRNKTTTQTGGYGYAPSPPSSYGPPPAMEYGPPPSTGYGAPPAMEYGAPPAMEYHGPPPMEYHAPPAMEYGAPHL